ncbi:CYTH and CHAD domain-containing protein [Cellulomonas aerilata]|uniref:CHAD domain-containing protein n=1 Tax=Cellulomonas aerilata TaxID=515326 RepID=A0A512DCA8_9CELL|nr:CYTH and CHAD domain-containing protein [Cellulomonas aerilata]GEO34057.1 CHAD domain-containing protein [Cellulomonas aerilata]
MVTVHDEVETKYDADADFQVPGLVELFGPLRGRDGLPDADGTPWSEGEAAQHELRAVYYDTVDLRLAASGLTLRRREGGDDGGWHLKVPVPDGARSEVRLPLEDGADAVPQQLVTMTYARTAGRPLVPVARIETQRTVRRLVDPTGRVLVEVADDRVTARRLGDAAGAGGDAADAPDGAQTWREIEVELVDGPRELLAAVDPLLRERGLVPAASASKLMRTLGVDGGSTAAPDAPRPKASSTKAAKAKKAEQEAKDAERRAARALRRGPAADVVLDAVGTHVAQIRDQDLLVRLDAPGAVHAMRVATRRLRSTLTTFEPLFHSTVTRPLTRELRRLAAVLGTARDAEVMGERLEAAVAGEEPDRRLGATVADEVSDQSAQAYREAHEGVVRALESERYRTLLDTLEALLTNPPLQDRASGPAAEVLGALVAQTFADLRTAMTEAHSATEAHERTERLHDARKAAKRARYAAEAVTPVFGKDARAFGTAMESVQEALGEHLDSVNTVAHLRELAQHTSQPSTAFTYGRLHALEELTAERSRAAADAVWSAAGKKSLRRWLL